MGGKKVSVGMQSIQLVDEKPQAVQIARFLRHCPGLSKQTIGDLLGEHDDFFLEVLDEFTKTFDFQGDLIFAHTQQSLRSTQSRERRGTTANMSHCH